MLNVTINCYLFQYSPTRSSLHIYLQQQLPGSHCSVLSSSLWSKSSWIGYPMTKSRQLEVSPTQIIYYFAIYMVEMAIYNEMKCASIHKDTSPISAKSFSVLCSRNFGLGLMSAHITAGKLTRLKLS